MTDVSQQDISDAARAFSVDEIIKRNSSTEGADKLFGIEEQTVETLLRQTHDAANALIERYVKERQQINEQIKGLRRDAAILAAAVNRYDRSDAE